MRETDAELIAKWQSTPEGEAFTIIDNFEKAAKELKTLTHTRAGVQELRKNRDTIIEASEIAHDVLYATRPRMEAAE